MKPKLALCLALVLSGLAFGLLSVAFADGTDASVGTNVVPVFTVKSNWVDVKVTLYRSKGGAVQLDAKREVVNFHDSFDLNIVAFVDPETGNAWVGESFPPNNPEFYLETDAGIVCGRLLSGAIALGMSRADTNGVQSGSSAFVEVLWLPSFVEQIGRGETVQTVIERFNKNYDRRWLAPALQKRTLFGSNLERVEGGLDPWPFIGEKTTIEGIQVSGGKLRLDLKSPKASASVWIDLKTWEVAKAVQDSKP